MPCRHFYSVFLEYVIMQFQANQRGFKLNGTIIFWSMLTLIYEMKAHIL